MLKEVQLPQNGTMMPAVTKKFAISSSMRHEEGSCCEEGYSGLQKVTSPALTWVFLAISAKTHSLRFAYRSSSSKTCPQSSTLCSWTYRDYKNTFQVGNEHVWHAGNAGF